MYVCSETPLHDKGVKKGINISGSLIIKRSFNNAASVITLLYSADELSDHYEPCIRSKYEIVDMIETQRQLLLKEFSRMEGVGDG